MTFVYFILIMITIAKKAFWIIMFLLVLFIFLALTTRAQRKEEQEQEGKVERLPDGRRATPRVKDEINKAYEISDEEDWGD